MAFGEIEAIIAVAKYHETFRWYEAERDVWVLDWYKWRGAYTALGYEVPEIDDDDRFGILVVDDTSVERFVSAMEQFEVPKDDLAMRLKLEFPGAESWWDVEHLFPVVSVDFDKKHLAAFYSFGTAFEKYVPDGWTSSFEDFSDQLPIVERYWVQNGRDLLNELIERGRDVRPKFRTE